MTFPIWLRAGFWRLIVGSVLLIDVGIGFYLKIPPPLIAAVMAFGSGVLISTLSFDLMDGAYKRGGFDATALGFVGGATILYGGELACEQPRGRASQPVGRPAAVRNGRRRQRSGDRGRRVARRDSRIDRYWSQSDQRRRGQLGGSWRYFSQICPKACRARRA